MYTEQSLLGKLRDLGIAYDYISHPAVFTSAEANEVMPSMTGAHCKNLFVKDRTGRKWLLTIPDDRRADLKIAAGKIGSGRLCFCSADEVSECLGVSPGSVTPLAVINDINNRVDLIVDKTVMDWDIINCHPMINTATISIKSNDFREFIEYTNHNLTVMEIV